MKKSSIFRKIPKYSISLTKLIELKKLKSYQIISSLISSNFKRSETRSNTASNQRNITRGEKDTEAFSPLKKLMMSAQKCFSVISQRDAFHETIRVKNKVRNFYSFSERKKKSVFVTEKKSADSISSSCKWNWWIVMGVKT